MARDATTRRSATRMRLLNRRAWRVAVGAEHTAIARLGLQKRVASHALVEILAGVRRHGLEALMPADRQNEGGDQLCPKHVSVLGRGGIGRVCCGADESRSRRLGVVVRYGRGLVFK